MMMQAVSKYLQDHGWTAVAIRVSPHHSASDWGDSLSEVRFTRDPGGHDHSKTTNSNYTWQEAVLISLVEDKVKQEDDGK